MELSGLIPEPAIRSGDTGQQKHYFDSCQLIKTWMYSIRLQAPKLARKCEIKLWYACGADGRKVGWSVYGHVIAEFSRMDRFSKLWGFELSPWSNKISAQNFNYVTYVRYLYKSVSIYILCGINWDFEGLPDRPEMEHQYHEQWHNIYNFSWQVYEAGKRPVDSNQFWTCFREILVSPFSLTVL